ncbi:MAG: transposase [Candidatus Uhrbacteria bacterium]
MARPLRVEYPGALYHVTSRGNAKNSIFLTDKDRFCFLEILKNVCDTHNWICYAYCLMDNHYHLLIESVDATLSSGMRDLNGVYTQRFNYLNDSVGHIFQGRFKSFVIEKEFYLLRVARYTVLNPVRAGLVRHPRDWRWCSYNETIGNSKAILIKPEPLLEIFGDDLVGATEEYKIFVEEGVDEKSPFEEIDEGVILGSPQFVSLVQEKTQSKEKIKEIPRSERIVGRPTFSDLFDEIENVKDRNNAIIFARNRCGYLIAEIARHLDIDPSTAGKIVKKG